MANANVLNVGDNDFEKEVLNSDVPVLIDFWAPWCAPCRQIAPAVEELATKYAGKAKVAKVNIDDHQGVAQRYNVMSIPTLYLFKGGQPVGQIIGAVKKDQIEDMIKKAL